MASIGQFLGEDHRRCDDSFLAAERAVDIRDWDVARLSFTEFHRAIERHLAMEEQVLFVAYEALAGTAGPSQVMRIEHEQMRTLFTALADALERCDGTDFLGLSETLLVLMQQHNMKEEQIFYPLCERLLGAGCENLIERMRKLHAAETA